MKFLLDTNVIMDVLTQRAPFEKAATQVWALVERKQIEACVSAVSYTTVYYLARRMYGRERAEEAVRKVAEVFNTALVDAAVIQAALASKSKDFEDAVQLCSGAAAGATHVVTRDPGGFTAGSLTVVSPDELLQLVQP